MARTARLIALTAGLGSCAVGTVYSVFSLNVMPALAKLPAPEAIERMQEFNRSAVLWPFMSLFFGTAALSTYVLAKEGRRTGIAPASKLRATGAGLYLGGFLLTVAFHVPRNDMLGQLSPASPSATAVWNRFQREWTAGNHVRAALSAAAASAMVLSAAGQHRAS